MKSLGRWRRYSQSRDHIFQAVLKWPHEIERGFLGRRKEAPSSKPRFLTRIAGARRSRTRGRFHAFSADPSGRELPGDTDRGWPLARRKQTGIHLMVFRVLISSYRSSSSGSSFGEKSDRRTTGEHPLRLQSLIL